VFIGGLFSSSISLFPPLEYVSILSDEEFFHFVEEGGD
jgi:hypothetical protein